MRRGAVALALAGAGAIALGAQSTPPPQQSVFRTTVDAVVVDVVVKEGGKPITGLRAEDFILTDNGVRQGIDTADPTSVPVDLSVILDVSGNPRRPWQDPPSVEKMLADINRELAAVAQSLRPEDRVRVLAIDRQVVRVMPFRTREQIAPLTPFAVNGLPSLFDTLGAALMHSTPPARRHVVVARTKGFDSFSVLDAGTVRMLAERSDALLHVSVMENSLDNDIALTAFQCQFMGLCWPTSNFWVPRQGRLVGGRPRHLLLPDGEQIAAAAEATGGGMHQAQLLTTPTLTDIFRKTMDEYRNGYVLRYTPRGVSADGWHAIEVKVPGKNYRIRARPGYFVEPSRPSASTPATTTPPVLRTLRDLIAAYDRRDYAAVRSALLQGRDPLQHLIDFEASGNPWPAVPRREAAFALELVEPGIFSADQETKKEAYATLDRFSRLIRQPLGPDIFERYWYFAALTMVEGSIQPTVTEAIVARARGRFPDEPRFMLSEAIAADQRWPGRSYDGTRPSNDHTARVRRLYEATLAHPETAVESRIRLAWFVHRIGEHEGALVLLDEATPDKGDNTLLYLRLLFRGHVLTALKRQDEAIRDFSAASAILPTAQSARVALMNARLLAGERAEAEALAERIQSETSVTHDPWWMYWQGQYRFQEQAFNRVRELAR